MIWNEDYVNVVAKGGLTSKVIFKKNPREADFTQDQNEDGKGERKTVTDTDMRREEAVLEKITNPFRITQVLTQPGIYTKLSSRNVIWIFWFISFPSIIPVLDQGGEKSQKALFSLR